jgi:cobalt-precorrin 5A hydrolase
MDGAVITLTPGGRELALRVAEKTGFTAYLPVALCEKEDQATPFVTLQAVLDRSFSSHRQIVLIMACGIAVRLLAPLLQDKRTDPAVVVLDERARYAISLLSGHWGGANDLARLLCDVVGAEPVITTATDVNGMTAVDVFAREQGLNPEPFARVKDFNAAMLRGEQIAVFTADPQRSPGDEGGLIFLPLTRFHELGGKYSFRALVTHLASFPGAGEADLYLRPPNLYVGLGCRRGTAAEHVVHCIREVLARANLAAGSLAGLASIDRKRDEPGLHQAAAILGLPLHFYSAEEIRAVPEPGEPSLFVYQNVGVGCVCEPTAMLAAGCHRVLVRKQKMSGVTVAVAQAVFPWSDWAREMCGA